MRRITMEPSPTRYIKVQGKRIEVDEDGNLKCAEDWSEELAIYLSKEDGIELSKDHWEVINCCRWYYLTYQNCPHPKFIVKKLNKGRESEKYTVKYLYELFREQPIMKACKYGGIPFTAGCT
jgi:tRNA 2-thiouridine synthesizing protein E